MPFPSIIRSMLQAAWSLCTWPCFALLGLIQKATWSLLLASQPPPTNPNPKLEDDAAAAKTNINETNVSSVKYTDDDEADEKLGQPPPIVPHEKLPTVYTHKSIHGEWAKKRWPHLPASAFEMPKEIPFGHVYHVSKGDLVGWGNTARLELTLEGKIVKSPKLNPYSSRADYFTLQDMRTEYRVYRRLGDCPWIPKLYDWDSESCSLTLEYMSNGCLRMYIEQNSDTITPKLRQMWVLQAARALHALHQADVIHCDLQPRNILLNTALELRLTDFAGSSISGSKRSVWPPSCYQRPGSMEEDSTPASKLDDIFALGSIIYFIETGKDPHGGIDEEEIERLLAAKEFPDVTSLVFGSVIEGCWHQTFTSTDKATQAIELIYAHDS